MTSTAELRSGLLAALEATLAEAGFRRTEQSFWKQWGQAKLCVHISFIKHSTDFDATIDVAVRHIQVEDRLNESRRNLSARQKRQTATIGVELGNWGEGRPHRWTVSGPADVRATAASMLSEIRRIGYPFLERFASLPELGRVLDADEKEARLICPVPEKRSAVRALVRDLLSGRAA